MPYLKSEDRQRIIAGECAHTAGELNFAITRLVIQYVQVNRLHYSTINDVIGALDGSKAEFQRRVVGPYEDHKIEDNGDLPWPQVH